jgi:amidohydrolase
MDRTELESHLISIRRHLHQYPELSNEEFETTNSIKKWLQDEEIDIRSTGLPTGVVAEIKGY